jgi:hypothetical protein
MKIIETIATRKLMNGPFIVRNLVNKGLNRSIAKLLKMKNSIVLYKGISQLDQWTPIMVVLSGYTKDSTNTKTGPLAQLYILPVDTAPMEAYKAGSKAVCGTCKYNAVPVDFWKDILSSCESYTGYTHQWREPFAEQYKGMFMASVDNARENKEARSKEWNTFFVTDGEEPPQKSVQCLATIPDKTDRNGLPMSCASCMMCNGKGEKTVTVQLHGASNTMSKARKARA